MADFDWGTVSGQTTDILQVRKIAAVPDAIKALAQKSYNGTELVRNGKVVTDDEGNAVITHNLRHVFPTEAIAKEFGKHMRNAGDYVTTDDGKGSSVSVVIDPDDDGKNARTAEQVAVGKRTVAWKAGARRGRTPGA